MSCRLLDRRNSPIISTRHRHVDIAVLKTEGPCLRASMCTEGSSGSKKVRAKGDFFCSMSLTGDPCLLLSCLIMCPQSTQPEARARTDCRDASLCFLLGGHGFVVTGRGRTGHTCPFLPPSGPMISWAVPFGPSGRIPIVMMVRQIAAKKPWFSSRPPAPPIFLLHRKAVNVKGFPGTVALVQGKALRWTGGWTGGWVGGVFPADSAAL